MIWLRSLGYTVDKVERRLPRGFVTVDCFGFADILALRPPLTGVLAVQATTAAHLQERIHKVRDEPRAKLWIECGNRIWVVGWSLRGEARKRWIPKVFVITQAGAFETGSDIIREALIRSLQ